MVKSFSRIPIQLAVFLVATSAAVARAEVEPSGSPFRIDPAVDLPLLGLGLSTALAAFVELPPPGCLPACDPHGINALDRGVLGNYSERLHSVADITVLGMAFLPLALDLIDSGGAGWAEDAAIHLQALVLTQGITQLTKAAVRRTAPFVYDPSVPLEVKLESADAPRSFFSGHTATAFAAASTYAVTYWLRHPNSGWRYVVAGLGLVLASTVAVLKIEAGYHFWSDVTAGALAGASVGILVPLLHTF